MSYGIKLWAADGTTVLFDSSAATGGVCLGFKTIPAGGMSYSYPDMVGRTGIALGAGAGFPATYSTDNDQGFLRFNFDYNNAGAVVALFAA